MENNLFAIRLKKEETILKDVVEITLKSENNTIAVKKHKDDVCIVLYFNGKYIGDIHFSCNSRGATIPQFLAIAPFVKHDTLANGNFFFRWEENEEDFCNCDPATLLQYGFDFYNKSNLIQPKEYWRCNNCLKPISPPTMKLLEKIFAEG